MTKKGYLIIDIGTGNVRVAVTDTNGQVLSVERGNVQYIKDELYPEAQHFNPDQLWQQVMQLAGTALQKAPGTHILAITASSQREGIVLLDKEGHSLIGLPNHDHRGREWEHTITGKENIYRLTGRYPSSLFSALKLIGLGKRRPELWQRTGSFLSISDWAQYQLSGVAGYEHSQASETQLFDVEAKSWSAELCEAFGINPKWLPPLHAAGTVLGPVLPAYVQALGIPPETIVIAGGADTQLAIKSTQPAVEDVVVVSGTTTPVVKLLNGYVVDNRSRTWTNRDIVDGRFVLEANAGVTGLNYQRLKEIFYPNESYDLIEQELATVQHPQCVASLGSLVAEEKDPLTKGGFIFTAPVSHLLTRAYFVWAILWDIACCIKENYDVLYSVAEHRPDYIWACGGGVQSRTLRQFIANLLNRKVQVRSGYRQASVVGAAWLCNEVTGETAQQTDNTVETIYPQADRLEYYADLHKEWKQTRASFKQIS